MKVYFLDVTGQRSWSEWRGAQDLRQDRAKAGDLVFIHLSEFICANENRVLEALALGATSIEDWNSVCKCVQELTSQFSAGLDAPWVVFVSAEPRATKRFTNHVKSARKALSQSRRIAFRHGVEHHLGAPQIENLFGQLAVQLSQTDIASVDNLDDLMASVSLSTEKAMAVEALRILYRLFLVAQAKPEDLPTELLKTRLLLQDKQFSADYWSPVLREGKLREELCESDEDDVGEMVRALRGQTNWDAVAIQPHDLQLGLRRLSSMAANARRDAVL